MTSIKKHKGNEIKVEPEVFKHIYLINKCYHIKIKKKQTE